MPHSTLPRFEVSIRSGKNATRRALEKVLSGIAPLHLDPEELSIVELIMAEALNNIVEHAYPNDDPAGPIHIECTHLADGLHLAIFDQGYPMPDGAQPLGNRPCLNVDTDNLPEGGFGWFLIHDLAKDIHYTRILGENQLRLRIAVAYGRVAH